MMTWMLFVWNFYAQRMYTKISRQQKIKKNNKYGRAKKIIIQKTKRNDMKIFIDSWIIKMVLVECWMNTWCFAYTIVGIRQWSSGVSLLLLLLFMSLSYVWKCLNSRKQNVLWHIMLSIWCEPGRPLPPQHYTIHTRIHGAHE